jgi:hypothetical protein
VTGTIAARSGGVMAGGMEGRAGRVNSVLSYTPPPGLTPLLSRRPSSARLAPLLLRAYAMRCELRELLAAARCRTEKAGNVGSGVKVRPTLFLIDDDDCCAACPELPRRACRRDAA